MTQKLRAFNLALLLFVLMFGADLAPVKAQAKVVEEIRWMYDEIGKKIELSEKGVEDSTYAGIVSNELVVNKNNHVWPAVGNYQATYKFYYDSAGTEGHHYPDRLRKVVMKSSMSDRSYFEEYFFNESGALVFYYSKPEEPPIGDEPAKVEQQIYFAGERPIRVITGQKTSRRLTSKDLELGGRILTQSRRIKAFFARSLTLPG